MAVSPRLSNAAVNAACLAITTQLSHAATPGILSIYGGSQPAGATAATTETALASLEFATTAFGASSSGIAAANAITSTTAATGTGTAAWFRAYGAASTLAVFDGSVGVTTAENVVLNSVAISSGATVAITAMTFTLPMTS